MQILIGTDKYSEDLNDNGEVMHADQNGIPVSWNSYDHESGIVGTLIAVGTSEGDTSVTNGYRNIGTSQQHYYIDNISLEPTSQNGTLYFVTVRVQNGAGSYSEIKSSNPIYVYAENVPGRVFVGHEAFVENPFHTDLQSVTVSFEGFESEMCGINRYEFALGTEPSFSDIIPYNSFGIVMVNESHFFAKIELQLHPRQEIYASVRAHTGNKCPDSFIMSSSDTLIVDVTPPEVHITTVGVHENISQETKEALYQQELNSIDFRWTASDDISELINTSWCAGSLPYMCDIHSWSSSRRERIGIRDVSLEQGKSIYFTLHTEDGALNEVLWYSQALTGDTTPPEVHGFTCNDVISYSYTYISCTWNSALDEESPLQKIRIGIGTDQLFDDIVEYMEIPHGVFTWIYNPDESILQTINTSTIVVTFLTENYVGIKSGTFQDITIDRTPPSPGIVKITTPLYPDEDSVKTCQSSLTTMQLEWEGFVDDESLITRFDNIYFISCY